ncbi:Hypothetical protein NTJ_09323 [Nesidiocoris tenuis]|uniref:Uncharacterized protein n=1 Tax=Nesidiocoris tenuis TaxID=355587 RepID=A0ABN7B026_9HEMI|nr:Hypothetical protein NTJ_09323 [Nesidiocoris tenuis]
MNRRRNPREAKGQNAQNLEPSDSLVDSVTNVLSGGMGEKKTKSEESHEIFADDETEQQQPPVRASVDSLKNKCARCRVELSTKARYCRACYEGRAIWMPPRPTRKKRPNPRLKRIGEK